MRNLLKSKWRLAINTLPYILFIAVAKYLAHYYEVEFLSLNALFTAIISANIFLIGFLISGTLSDYKESERLPGEIASNIQSMFDEVYITIKNKNSDDAKEFARYLLDLNEDLINWFYKKTKTQDIYKKIFLLNDYLLKMEPLTQANFIVKMKNEQNSLRRTITRIHAIRETSFLGTGYAVAEIITTLLVIGLIFVNVNPFHEKMFFVSFVSFVMIYMIFFIKDLDNPFSYYNDSGFVEDVSLKPVIDSKNRIEEVLKDLS